MTQMRDLLNLPTEDRFIDLSVESKNPTVIFFYPRTGEPTKPAPPDWDLIPGARGCTPQSCGFRDIYADFKLTDAIKLPTFTYDGMKLIKRLALVLSKGRIEKVFYPVFPPDKNAKTVLNWIKETK